MFKQYYNAYKAGTLGIDAAIYENAGNIEGAIAKFVEAISLDTPLKNEIREAFFIFIVRRKLEHLYQHGLDEMFKIFKETHDKDIYRKVCQFATDTNYPAAVEWLEENYEPGNLIINAYLAFIQCQHNIEGSVEKLTEIRNKIPKCVEVNWLYFSVKHYYGHDILQEVTEWYRETMGVDIFTDRNVGPWQKLLSKHERFNTTVT